MPELDNDTIAVLVGSRALNVDKVCLAVSLDHALP